MITCCIRYTINPIRLVAFERYVARWPPIIAVCGGDLVGYFLPKEGANNIALALIDFESLAEYEQYRQRLLNNVDAQENIRMVNSTEAILAESRTFFRRA